MTTTVKIENIPQSHNLVTIETTFGDPIKVQPGETQVITLYPGHSITAITEGDAVVRAEAGQEAPVLTDDQNAAIHTLTQAYPGYTVTANVEAADDYSIVDPANGNEFARGSFALLKSAADAAEELKHGKAENPAPESDEKEAAPEDAPEVESQAVEADEAEQEGVEGEGVADQEADKPETPSKNSRKGGKK